MSARLRTIVVLGVVAIGLALSAFTLHARDEKYTLPGTAENLMYLRSGATASRVMLSFKAIAADIYWIRAIQHYGRERKTGGHFDLLQPLLDLTTTLDPRFNIAYRFGAIFLSMEAPNGPGRADQAIALLKKGLDANPARGQYAHDIGFIYYWYTSDKVSAAQWFEQAARMPGAPSWIRPLAATTLVEGGDRAGARAMLSELRTSEEKYVRDAAERSLSQLKALDDLDALSALITQYAAHNNGAYPASMIDLMHASGYAQIPIDPARVPYVYDPVSHTASLSPQSPLNPMPKGFRPK
jgi:tetratricopeptide (TPR) repeat protein